MFSHALLLADARLPTGGHTQSGALEPALLAGMPEAEIEQFLVTRLRTSIRVDAATAVVTRADPDRAEDVISAWNARTPSHVVREASCQAARGYLRLGVRGGLDARWNRRTDVPRPVAVGLLAAHWRLDAEETARVVCHDEVQAVASAALKLAPLDPIDTVGWSLGVADEIDEVVDAVRELTSPDHIPAATAPLLELWQHAHPTHTRRLFRA